MYNELKSAGYEVGVFCEYYDENMQLSRFEYSQLKKIAKKKNSIIIYHHSIEWDLGEEILDSFCGVIVIRYHNITPSNFFSPYSQIYFEKTEKGGLQTKRFIKKYKRAQWLCDSKFNSDEIITLGAEKSKIYILPPFHHAQKLVNTVEDNRTMSMLRDSNKINVLFTGRIAPNKGHRHLIMVINSYKRLFGDKLRLWVVGSEDPELKAYKGELESQIKNLNLHDSVHFMNHVTEAELKAFYAGCQTFLCLSEHEGFCVPIVESQALNTPVIGVNRGAISDTAGNKQLIYEDYVYEELATAIYMVNKYRDISNYLIDEGRNNYHQRFELSIIGQNFLKILQNELMED